MQSVTHHNDATNKRKEATFEDSNQRNRLFSYTNKTNDTFWDCLSVHGIQKIEVSRIKEKILDDGTVYNYREIKIIQADGCLTEISLFADDKTALLMSR